MAKKYIEADALRDELHKHEDYKGGLSYEWEAIIADFPAADVRENVRGEWIKRDSYDRRDNFYACSECGRIINIICNAHLEDYPFCHCGADMRGEEHGHD